MKRDSRRRPAGPPAKRLLGLLGALLLVLSAGLVSPTATISARGPDASRPATDFSSPSDTPGIDAAIPQVAPATAPGDLFREAGPGALDGVGRVRANGVFKPGERLTMRVTYMGMTAGYFTIRVGEDRVDDRSLYTLKMKARTAGAVDWFYKVRDTLVSYVDVQGLYSWGYDYFQDHGGEKETTRVRYDQANGFVIENGERSDSVPRYTQDILSALYYLRSQDLQVGQSYSFPVHVSDDYYQLVLTVDGMENIATYEGWQEAYRLVPDVRSKKKAQELQKKVYRNRKGGVRLWISTDGRRLPLRVALPARFGTFYGYLEAYSPGPG